MKKKFFSVYSGISNEMSPSEPSEAGLSFDIGCEEGACEGSNVTIYFKDPS